MGEIRSFERFETKDIKASYLLEEVQRSWQKCTIKVISYKGMGIIFHTNEEIKVGSTIHLKVFTYEESEYFTVSGILKWIEKKQNAFVGGIELTVLLSEAEWIQLSSFLTQDSLVEQVEDIRHTTLQVTRMKHRHFSPSREVGLRNKLNYLKSILKDR